MSAPVTPPLPMITADVHTHYLTDRYVAEARQAGIVRPDNMPRWPTWTVDNHRALMDRCGIQRGLLSISSPGVHFGDDAKASALATHVNDVGASFARSDPERFGHFGALPLPDIDAALDEARRCLDDLGSDGVAVLTNHRGRYLGHESFKPLWDELDRRSAIVFVHPTSPVHAEAVDLGRPHPMIEFIIETTRTVSDLALTNVFDRLPNIQWIFSHGGGALPVIADRIELFRTTVLGDHSKRRTVTEQLRDVWFDLAGTPFPHQVPATVAAFGYGHLLYGSDACWTTDSGVEHQMATVNAADPPPRNTWRDLLNHNAAQLLT